MLTPCHFKYAQPQSHAAPKQIAASRVLSVQPAIKFCQMYGYPTADARSHKQPAFFLPVSEQAVM